MISEIVNTLFLTYLASEYVVAKYNSGNDFVFSGQQKYYHNVFLGGVTPTGSSPADRNDPRITLVVMVSFVGIVNIVDHYIIGATSLVHNGLDVLEHYAYLVRFIVAATSYIITLYVDINRQYFFGGLGFGTGSTTYNSDDDDGDERDDGDDNHDGIHDKSNTGQRERAQTRSRNQTRTRRRVRQRRRRKLVLPCRAFLPRVGRSFIRVLPAYPFLAVLISFIFMFVISIWDFLKLPEEWLQWPIYYGTLYGPFVYVYCTLKRQILCMDGYSLPS